MGIDLFNLTNENLDEYFKIMKEVLLHGLEKLKVSDVSFNIIIVDNPYIHNINKEYRHIDRETDVITFALEDDKTFNPDIRILGDVYISIDKVISQAEEYGHSLLREICFLATHGILHLLGYDHETEEDKKIMRQREEEVMEKLGLGRDVTLQDREETD